ncbi:MAG: beta-phosphoglucomutase family hydrolase [Acidobacteriota bacterium]
MINAITPEKFDAVLFDLDGVLTATATVHATCWKRMFDDFLRQRAAQMNEPFRPFDIATDYKQYLDGKLRYEGVRSFLESRRIHLPKGKPDSPSEEASICGLGNRKNVMVNDHIRTKGVETYQGAVDLAHRLRRDGIKIAVVSASHNCQRVLEAAGIADLFEARVDGHVADHLKLAGKPAPDTFLKAAEDLGVVPKRAVVIEDALSGVQAGRAGGFGLVIGVDHEGNPDVLRQNGADIVVADLAELLQ